MEVLFIPLMCLSTHAYSNLFLMSRSKKSWIIFKIKFSCIIFTFLTILNLKSISRTKIVMRIFVRFIKRFIGLAIILIEGYEHYFHIFLLNNFINTFFDFLSLTMLFSLEIVEFMREKIVLPIWLQFMRFLNYYAT